MKAIRLSDMSTDNEFLFHHGVALSDLQHGPMMDAPMSVDAGSARYFAYKTSGFVARSFVFLDRRY